VPKVTETEGRAVSRQLGERERASGLTCPWCQGGQSGERSLIAWRDGLALHAKCKRAKCNRYGAWDAVGLGMQPVMPGRHPQGKRYVLNTLPMEDATLTHIQARYRLAASTVFKFGLRQMPGGRACYCPVYGPTMKPRGWVRRWMDGTVPKVKGYPSFEHPEGAAWQAWFPSEASRGRLAICVEDVFSAMRLWEIGITAVALLGVSLTPVKVAELRRFAETIVVALDADAFTLAISDALRFHINVRRIEPDIKDMTEEQLTQWTNALYSSLPASNPETPALP
jgi:hypothetical protein